MAQNFIEDLLCEYFQARGYLVMKNVWFSFKSERKRRVKNKIQTYTARSWSDIDILARNDTELLIIQVKAIINSAKTVDLIKTFFPRARKYIKKGIALDGISDIGWWHNNLKIKKIVVYESYSPPGYISKVQRAGITVNSFDDYFSEIVEYVKEREGVKEENASVRLLHYLSKRNYLETSIGA